MTDAASGSPTRQKRAADGGQVADGSDRSPARRGGIGRVARKSAEGSPRQSLPPDASELNVSSGTPPARDGAASTAQVGAADMDETGDSPQGTELLSTMNEIGEERQCLTRPTKAQGKQQRRRAAAAMAKAQFQGSDVQRMLGDDDEGEAVELEGTPLQQEAAPGLTTKQSKKQRLREKKRAAGKGRVGQDQKGAQGRTGAAMSEAEGGNLGGKHRQSQAELEGS